MKSKSFFLGIVFGSVIVAILPHFELSISIRDLFYLIGIAFWIGTILYRNLVIKKETIVYESKFKLLEITVALLLMILIILLSITYLKQNYRLYIATPIAILFIALLIFLRIRIVITNNYIYFFDSVESINKIIIQDSNKCTILVNKMKYKLPKEYIEKIQNLTTASS